MARGAGYHRVLPLTGWSVPQKGWVSRYVLAMKNPHGSPVSLRTSLLLAQIGFHPLDVFWGGWMAMRHSLSLCSHVQDLRNGAILAISSYHSSPINRALITTISFYSHDVFPFTCILLTTSSNLSHGWCMFWKSLRIIPRIIYCYNFSLAFACTVHNFVRFRLFWLKDFMRCCACRPTSWFAPLSTIGMSESNT